MNPPPTVKSTAIWTAHPAASTLEKPSQLSPASVNAQWQPLLQHWLPALHPDFQPGWSRITWNKDFLVYDIVLTRINAKNSARRMNEYTYDLGDVCEVFVEAEGSDRYLELHITPENQRLQLHWPQGGLDKLRAGQAKLEEFMVASPDWVRTSTHVTPDYWTTQAIIPTGILGLPSSPLSTRTALTTAVCSYDYTAKTKPTHSSTAFFKALSFHRRPEWHNLVLASS